MAKAKKNDFSSKFRVNDEIRVGGNVRIVGEGIESKVVAMSEARKIAEDMELDLVEIQGKSDVPIVRVCNYEKMLYELKKAAKKNKQQVKPLKEIQLSVNIAKHDLETKANNAQILTRVDSGNHSAPVIITVVNVHINKLLCRHVGYMLFFQKRFFQM